MSITLRSLREVKKLSLDAVASVCGVSRQAVSLWELGYRVPNSGHLLFLSLLYGIPMDSLYSICLSVGNGGGDDVKTPKEVSAVHEFFNLE